MPAGDDPGAVFDALHAGGHIAVHASQVQRSDTLADHLATARLSGGTATVVVDTREHAATLNSAIRDRLVTAGAVDDRRVAITHDGQRIGAGDVIVTRRNNHDLGVANRETWTVTRAHRDGRLTVDDAERGQRKLPAEYVRGHVELGYAVTGYGAQGDTTTDAHLVLTETTTAAAGYVAMTRGREANTAHLVAADLDDARDQWIAAFSRDRADLGPAAASQTAARAAAGYRTPRPLSDVLAELRNAWTNQRTARWQLEHLQARLDHTQAQAAWEARCRQTLAPLETASDAARTTLEHAEHAATGCAAILFERTEQHATRLRHAWDAELPAVEHAARALAAGPGRLGIHRGRIRNAKQHLDTWTDRWSAALTGSDLDPTSLRHWPDGYRSTNGRVSTALERHARLLAADDLPDQAAQLRTAELARQQYNAAAQAYHQTRGDLQRRSPLPTYDTGAADQLPELTKHVEAAQQRVQSIDQQIDLLTNDPAITSHHAPQALLQHTTTRWATDQRAASRRRRPEYHTRFDQPGTTRHPSARSTTAHPLAAKPTPALNRPPQSTGIPDRTPSTRRKRNPLARVAFPPRRNRFVPMTAGSRQPQAKGHNHGRPGPPAYYHRSRRPPPQARGNPVLVAARRHRPAQLQDRTRCPLPNVRRPRLDRSATRSTVGLNGDPRDAR
jgi:hypothetical protein